MGFRLRVKCLGCGVKGLMLPSRRCSLKVGRYADATAEELVMEQRNAGAST